MKKLQFMTYMNNVISEKFGYYLFLIIVIFIQLAGFQLIQVTKV